MENKEKKERKKRESRGKLERNIRKLEEIKLLKSVILSLDYVATVASLCYTFHFMTAFYSFVVILLAGDYTL